ncbi:hypothetical protein [Amycolatopsis sp. EV170708-02-1]|uniref:hypothetical protein n=1 Tax=Amycolatopsis sp. EV170708-02-1 TaxID=2919322 RepID=UPI001F0B72CA|nr:hypothetical protein [Amycolatopsis sp. EV170708-02-1]UMO99831.1 hypothetical protein MJQ72_25290 [Amycolatopsis sp. EV170708-02-1]
MITVKETWYLREDIADRAMELMQEMDDLTGPNAHDDPGWAGHARFFRRETEPGQVIMIYPWRSHEDHARLRAAEKSLLAEFHTKYCTRERDIEYLEELPVDVDGEHGHGH